jgi:hypothetical protein
MNMDSVARLRQGLHKHFGQGAAVFVDPVLWLVGYVTGTCCGWMTGCTNDTQGTGRTNP